MQQENKEYNERIKLFKKYGYDVLQSRRFVLKKANLYGKILEIGTGRGHLAMALAQKGLKVVSIDIDKDNQNIARSNLKKHEFEKLVSLKIMNAEKLKYKCDYFDCVISVNFIHHARRPLPCIKEMVRVTKGKLVLSDLNKKGERVMEKIHAMEGNIHPRSKISFKALKIFLVKSGMQVKTHRTKCETILIANKPA